MLFHEKVSYDNVTHAACQLASYLRLRLELLFWHMARYKCRLLTYLLTYWPISLSLTLWSLRFS